MDTFPGVQVIQEWNRRGIIGCKHSVAAQSKDGRKGGLSTWRLMGKYPEKVDTMDWGSLRRIISDLA